MYSDLFEMYMWSIKTDNCINKIIPNKCIREKENYVNNCEEVKNFKFTGQGDAKKLAELKKEKRRDYDCDDIINPKKRNETTFWWIIPTLNIIKSPPIGWAFYLKACSFGLSLQCNKITAWKFLTTG